MLAKRYCNFPTIISISNSDAQVTGRIYWSLKLKQTSDENLRGNYGDHSVVIRKMSTLTSGHKTAFTLLTVLRGWEVKRASADVPYNTLSLWPWHGLFQHSDPCARPPVKQEGGRKRSVGILAAASVSKLCPSALLHIALFKWRGCYFVSVWLFPLTLTSEFCSEIFINFILFHFNLSFSFCVLSRLPWGPRACISCFGPKQDTFSSLE